MKRLALLLVVALASAAVAYFLVGLREPRDSLHPPGDLSWLQTEFELTDEQFGAVCKVHDEYSGQCARHCADIIAARDRLASLGTDAPAAEHAAATTRIAELEAVCNEATRTHLRRVAALMPEEQGERFLRTVEPHLAQLPHDPAVRDGFGR